ncbi:MAG TPA: ATP-dependent RNA helicase HrpA [Povalibacter sp.]|uniref:ATP-dependent RNA helicase HrpA n=1 Tax=Povalibacter sp. TaxID=1962978 RepID=UPI002CC2D77B|nr:ATP-dependent RNA helicase HrpA [Povalibacter sp.]HMN45647.1 ATP-dependent RNA helicase HrpA [Povalibacter sp.]
MTTAQKSINDRLLALRERLPLTRLTDRARLAREMDRLFARRDHGAEFERVAAALSDSIDKSAGQVERLRQLPLRLQFDAELPITAHREEIATALAKHQVIVVCGATGSGKTTQLPKICLEAGRGAFGLIGHTQPRRIAARAIADRLAVELGTTVGGAVGYQVRFTDRVGPDGRIKLMTDGILLRELENDRLLRRYDTLIIDEAHERNLNIDFLLGVLRQILPKRPELRIVITSATIDPQRFADFFGGAPVIEVSGRSYPVEVRYRPLFGDDEETELSLPEGIVSAVRELDRESRGDVLVFLPGEKQIRDAADELGKAKLHHTEILPLYSRLSTRDQERIFEGHSARRIVLATNVAETSLTVPGIKYVVDSGLARISRYSVRGKVQRLPIEPVSQASADQRKGRCGRESEGICIRLFAEDEFLQRPEFTPPEILRTNLASVILQMSTLGLGEPEDFPFVDPPDTRLINDGYRLLQELKAVDDSRRVTSLGKQIATLPVDPRLARMLVAAGHHRCVAEMLILSAFLASQDPRERPSDAQQQADQKHATYADPRSDFVTVLNLWKLFQEQSAALSGNQLRKWCRENFVSFLRMREWQELHRQLGEVVADLKLPMNQAPAEYGDLHQAILTGFLGGIGVLDEKREYEGARGTRFVIAPGTPLASKPPKWVVAASLMETTRLYARMVAAVEPQWIEAAGDHLVKRSYSEPHWVEERGFVAAFESTSLYGLTLSARRRVNYGNVAPREAREIFVREALIEGRSKLRAGFIKENRALREQVERLEAKIRRRDILVDEQAMVEFYLSHLPEHIHSTAALERWLKEPANVDGAALKMQRADLLRRAVDDIDENNYPEQLRIEGNALPLVYRFEPTAADDGITLTVPEPLLPMLDAGQLAWLIPGWLEEKVTAALRALPKSIRKSLVPVPEHAARAVAEIDRKGDFNAAMAAWITRATGEPISGEEVSRLPLPDALRINIRVADLQGNRIAEGRDLGELRRTLRSRGTDPVSQARQMAAATKHRTWDFGALPHEQSVERKGLRFTVCPTLHDRGDSVDVVESRSPQEAAAMLRQGVLRLAVLALPEQFKYARKRFADQRELVLLGQGLNLGRPLADALAERAFMECFLAAESPLPRSAEAFQALLDRHRADFGAQVDRLATQMIDTLRELRGVREKLRGLQSPAFKSIVDVATAQLAVLVPSSFPLDVPPLLWPHLPRYLKALVRRLDKIAGNVKRDLELAQRVAPFLKAFNELDRASKGQAIRTELDKLQWMIEEFRVSLFAQDLRAVIPVSEKRLADQLELARAEARRV